MGGSGRRRNGGVGEGVLGGGCRGREGLAAAVSLFFGKCNNVFRRPGLWSRTLPLPSPPCRLEGGLEAGVGGDPRVWHQVG